MRFKYGYAFSVYKKSHIRMAEQAIKGKINRTKNQIAELYSPWKSAYDEANNEDDAKNKVRKRYPASDYYLRLEKRKDLK